MARPRFVYPSTGEHLGCSHLLAVENYAALDIHVQCVDISFIALGCLPKSRLAGSMVILFNLSGTVHLISPVFERLFCVGLRALHVSSHSILTIAQ